MKQSLPFLFSVQWLKQRVRGAVRVVVFAHESTFRAYMAELSAAGVRFRWVDCFTVEASK